MAELETQCFAAPAWPLVDLAALGEATAVSVAAHQQGGIQWRSGVPVPDAGVCGCPRVLRRAASGIARAPDSGFRCRVPIWAG